MSFLRKSATDVAQKVAEGAGKMPFIQKISQKIASKAPSMFFSAVGGGVCAVVANTAVIASSGRPLKNKINEIKTTSIKAATFGATAGLMLSWGIRKFPMPAATTGVVAGGGTVLSEVYDKLKKSQSIKPGKAR